jgi:hypothetical protein
MGEDSLLDRYGMFVRGATRLPREKYDLSSLLRCASTWWIAPSSGTVSDMLVLEYENRSMQERLAEEMAHSDNWETLNSCASICFGRELTISLKLADTVTALPFHTASEYGPPSPTAFADGFSIDCPCGKTLATDGDPSALLAAVAAHYEEDSCGYGLEELKALMVQQLDEIEMKLFIIRKNKDDA